jgi:single-stranded DNA-binding protein
MRIATDLFKNGERLTQWITVKIMPERLGKRTLSKGSLVEVFGTAHVSPYLDKNGAPQVSIDVFADRIEYVSLGKKENDGQESSSTTTGVSVDTGKFTRNEKEAAVAAASASSSVDDLPF